MTDKECMIKNVDRTFLASSKTKAKETTKKMLKVTATTSTGKKKEETIHTPVPKLMSVTWGLPKKKGKTVVDTKEIRKTTMIEQDMVNITPNEIYWKDKSKKNGKISATVYLVTYTGKIWLGEDTPESLAVEFNSALRLKNPLIIPSDGFG